MEGFQSQEVKDPPERFHSIDTTKTGYSEMELNERNPLQDPYILENVFSFVEVSDLRSCRMVNSTWCREATPYLKRKAMIYFNDHYDEEEEPPANFVGDYMDVAKYVKEMLHFQGKNYCLGRGAKYTEAEIRIIFQTLGLGIKYLRLDYEFHSHLNLELLREYLTTYLPNLEHLDIRNMPLIVGSMTQHMGLHPIQNEAVGHGTFDNLPVLWPKYYGPIPTFPNLKRVDIWNYKSYGGTLGYNFVEDVLDMAPNLQVLEVVDRYYNDIITKFLTAIAAKPIRATLITELRFDSCNRPSVEDLKLLSEMNHKLKVLRLGTLPKEMNASNVAYFQTILNKQAPTLRELQFGNSNAGTSVGIVLPVFPKLRVLELMQDIPKSPGFNVTFLPVNYQNQLPRLEVLANCRSRRFYQHDDMHSFQRAEWEGKHFFRGMVNLWKTLFPNDEQVCKSLLILDIPYPNDPSSKLLKKLAKMFPNVSNKSLNAARAVTKMNY